MNYRSQMKAHALDRALQYPEQLGVVNGDHESIKKASEFVEKYVYVVSEDARDTVKGLIDLFQQGGMDDLLDEAILALQVIQEQRNAIKGATQ